MSFNHRKQTKHSRAPILNASDDILSPLHPHNHSDSSADDYDTPSDNDTDGPFTGGANLVADDADITYSFDAPRGATQGSQVLSSALDKAVAQFESAVTDRIVREEYEVLDAAGEAQAAALASNEALVRGRKGKAPAIAAEKAARGGASAKDEVEYEFV